MKRPILVAAAVLAAAAVAPAGASAASIALTVPGGVPTIAYTADSGEVNAVKMQGTVQGPLDLRMAFFEYASPLTPGASCTGAFPVVCGMVDKSFPVTVSLGDEQDVAYINSFTGDVALDAGSDNDDVLAGGINATADGGSGNDVIQLAANGLTTGDGGRGRDKIAAGLGAAAARLTGGGNADLLVPGGFLFNDAKGGSGNDRLVSFTGDDVTLSGESGSDVLAAPTGSNGIVLDAGSGWDIAYSHVGSVVVDAGPGSDLVEVRGGSDTGADTVTCGIGWDVVWADANDSVAGDCELVIRHGTPPTLRRVQAAIEAARELIAHRPDPSAQK